MLNSIDNQTSSAESPDLTQRIKLATSSPDWEIISLIQIELKQLFKFKVLNQPITDWNLDSMVEHMNEFIYRYFKQNYLTVNSSNHTVT